jgi:hypothetical protein
MATVGVLQYMGWQLLVFYSIWDGSHMLCTCVGTAAVLHVSRTGWEALKCCPTTSTWLIDREIPGYLMALFQLFSLQIVEYGLEMIVNDE